MWGIMNKIEEMFFWKQWKINSIRNFCVYTHFCRVVINKT